MNASRPSSAVAVVGGGWAGICAARACLEEGLIPTVFEAASRVGGHWSLEDDVSGVFEGLTTNTMWYENTVSDVLPLRSAPDLSLGKDADMYLTGVHWREYMDHVIRCTPGLTETFRLRSQVVSVKRLTGQPPSAGKPMYTVTWLCEGDKHSEVFQNVVLATSRQQVGFVPDISGLAAFPGRIIHSVKYRRPSDFAGQRVLVVGGGISGGECVGDLLRFDSEEKGPAHVTMVTRSIGHFLAKQNDSRDTWTKIRCGNVSGLAMLSNTKDDPNRLEERFNGLSTNEEYGIMPCEPGRGIVPVHRRFCEAALNDPRLTVRVGVLEKLDEDGAAYTSDGLEETFDAIIFATGFRIDLPYLEEAVREQIYSKDDKRPKEWLDLYMHTWHTAVPHVAFVGMYNIGGPALPSLDTQSRWVARCFAEPGFMPSESEIAHGIEEFQKRRRQACFSGFEFVNEWSHRFAEKGGFAVDYGAYPDFQRLLIAGDFLPQMFRLCGHRSDPDPKEMFKRAAAKAGLDPAETKVSKNDIAVLKRVVEAFAKSGNSPAGLEGAVAQLEKELKQEVCD